MEPRIIIHGGFFSESNTNHEVKTAKQEALLSIVSEAYRFLKDHSALETVVYATGLLEDSDLFNAGTGSQIQGDGKIRLSASLMDGVSMKFSGVINIEDVKNPIRIAQKLMAHDDRVLSGSGALNFARQNGFGYFNPEIPQRRMEYEKKLNDSIRMPRRRQASGGGRGTVGAVALDAQSRLAAATSTGGKGFEIPGRVSDSATVAGNYANEYAAVSTTGVGEDIVSGAIAAKIVTRVTDGGSLQSAAQKTFAELRPFDGFAGMIGISSKGEIWHCDSHPYMVWASHDLDARVFS